MLSEELLLNCSKVTNITTEHLMELVKENQNNDDASDATWILTSAFIIFTMQSGFGLLEAGTVSSKNETNIMVKNALDVIFGALGYWVCGFAFSFGDDKNYANGFSGFGNFFVDVTNEDFGHLFSKYFFQLSFATTATTIVSGAMAERTNLKAYMFFSLVNFLSYVFPAHWIWDKNGFLKKRDVVDVAGCGPVHIVGGSSALIATIMLKPRQGIFDKNAVKANMASPTNVMLGTFMLWWGWLGFNCGSTFGVSGGKWKLASRTAVITVNGSVGGGLWSIIYCYCLTKRYNKKLDVSIFTSSILGGLVSITAICGVCRPWEALCIGFVGGMITCYGSVAVEALKIDDPVTCIPIHLFCGTWGLLAVGLFANKDTIGGLSANDGVLKGGKINFLGYQCLTIVCVAAWSCIATSIQVSKDFTIIFANFISF
ncbi:putative ammonium transporter 3 [Hydractinia symbiolongicarpus]|uniref:putative ammonium transporter 3 n=1 Tax=Hydractinia symbiolongicarpus TaxID=13093 RepID=UPI00254F6CBC|nr:putative ammonium transporter 3 [Hydractinia symbiolongicarpus]